MTNPGIDERAFDASALLALIRGEPGSELVNNYIPGAIMSSVNWSEVAQKCRQQGVAWDVISRGVTRRGLRIVPFSRGDAELAASLWQLTRNRGLSLGDRSCLAVAFRRGCPVVTADRAWASLAIDVPIELIR